MKTDIIRIDSTGKGMAEAMGEAERLAEHLQADRKETLRIRLLAEEALGMVQVSDHIRDALLYKKGVLYPLLYFMQQYENAAWTEVFRILVVDNTDMDDIYHCYLDALTWYRDLFA